MSNRFVDTSGWAAWCSSAERHHASAREAFDEVWQWGGNLITTTYVLAELTALFIRLNVPRHEQIELLGEIRADPSIIEVPIEPNWFVASWGLWCSRPDKDWTLVDCASFTIMNHRRVREAFTADHHFEQVGFLRLLK